MLSGQSQLRHQLVGQKRYRQQRMYFASYSEWLLLIENRHGRIVLTYLPLVRHPLFPSKCPFHLHLSQARGISVPDPWCGNALLRWGSGTPIHARTCNSKSSSNAAASSSSIGTG